MKRSVFLLTMLLLLSCKHESKFDLEKDLYQFSQKMENGDSLEVRVNHSACLLAAFENYTFIKENNTLYVEHFLKLVHLENNNSLYLKFNTS